MALAESLHHSANRTVTMRKEEVEQHGAPQGHKEAKSDPTSFQLFDEEDVSGMRPGAFLVLPPRLGARTLVAPPLCVLVAEIQESDG